MSDQRAERCETCRFWVLGHLISDSFGQCHRHAPLPSISADDESGGPAVAWPNTDAADWCGEWQSNSGLAPPLPNGELTIRGMHKRGIKPVRPVRPSADVGEWTDKRLVDLWLPVMAHNALEAEEVESVGQLCNLSSRDLKSIRWIGETMLMRIRAALAAHGLKLRGDP